MSDELVLRTATDADFDALGELISGAFLGDPEEEMSDIYRMVDEPERAHLITDGDRPVAHGAVLTRELTVPGAVVPAAHVTGVGVASTHRRRGLLRRIMTAQLDAIREIGDEPIAVLWASEHAIYGRFGYGMAAQRAGFRIANREMNVTGPAPLGDYRQVVPHEARDELAAVYERVRAGRPGLSGRPGRWWERRTADPKVRRHGMSSLRGVIYEDGGALGYACWRTKGGWGELGPDGEVEVMEVIAETPDAYAALWRFLLSIDLVRTVKYDFATLDEPLVQLVDNSTGLRPWIGASLWVRIVDVPAALSARRYLTPVEVVIEVADDMLPENTGRWHLVGDATSAKCVVTDADPDLVMNARDLGAAYLGGTSLLALAGAGRVMERREGALLPTSTAFGWHGAPSAIEIF